MYALLSFVVLVFCFDAQSTAKAAYHVHEKLPEAMSDWHQVKAPVDSAMNLPMRIALTQQNLHLAEDEILKVSDPSSPTFGRYWTSEEVVAHFAPANKTISTVMKWLSDFDIEPHRLRVSQDNSWILFNATIAESEKLLKAKYNVYKNHATGSVDVGTAAYSLPAGMEDHIDFIAPTVHLEGHDTALQKPSSRAASKAIAAANQSAEQFPLSSCYRYTTPECLRALYGIPMPDKSHPSNSLGVFEPAWVSWLPGDLDKFFDTFNKTLVGKRPVMAPINGGYWQDTVQASFFNDEPDLDMEYAMALTHPLPVTNYQVGDVAIPGTLSNLLAAFDAFYCPSLNSSIDGTYPDSAAPGGYNRTTDCGTISEPAKVLSISFAYDEADFPASYLRRQCSEFLKLGLQGVSVIVSSADCGPAGQSCKCTNRNNSTDAGDFRPTSPASCPFVTVVGGTQLPPNGTVKDKEVSFRHVSPSGRVSTSGGGFSNVFATPPWQIAHVATYFARQGDKLHGLAGRYNRTGRGIPDVATNAANYVVTVDGRLVTVLGTSASAPVFASVIAKLNDARLFAGKTPLGLLNPALYANPGMFNDIVNGSNFGCGGEAFAADRGWDPVTGLGTPNFDKMLDFYLRLP